MSKLQNTFSWGADSDNVEFLGVFKTTYTSKTTATSSGANLKTVIGDELFSEIVKSTNRWKYALSATIVNKAGGDDFYVDITAYNNVGTSTDRVIMVGYGLSIVSDWANPAGTVGGANGIAAYLAVNNTGEVRLYVRYNDAPSSVFNITEFRLWKFRE